MTTLTDQAAQLRFLLDQADIRARVLLAPGGATVQVFPITASRPFSGADMNAITQEATSVSLNVSAASSMELDFVAG